MSIIMRLARIESAAVNAADRALRSPPPPRQPASRRTSHNYAMRAVDIKAWLRPTPKGWEKIEGDEPTAPPVPAPTATFTVKGEKGGPRVARRASCF